jgi:hypothetical protein
MAREAFILEQQREDDSWETDIFCVYDDERDAAPDIDGNPKVRLVRYVPEDDAPRLLADWQDANTGRVRWSSDENAILCVLTADTRVATGIAGALDPFGAARVALKNWQTKWGAP